MGRHFVVAVDGTAGCGKSSICSATCQKNNWVYINTGALYRGVGYIAHKNNVDSEDPEALESLLEQFAQNYSWQEDTQELHYQGLNISDFLTAEEVGYKASQIASKPIVREKLLPLQRSLVNSYPNQTVLVDGRDIGTVVFPDAPLKIFMSASIEARAVRRLKQLQEAEPTHHITLEELKEDMLRRDLNDSNRKIAPLAQAKDAVLFETSDLSFEECVEKLSELIKKKKGTSPKRSPLP